MTTALLIVRLTLATVFAAAAFGKLADLRGSRQAVEEFGLPAALASPLGLLLPLIELGIAIALITSTAAWGGSLAAVTLLLLFIAGIVANLARGRTPDCHCFGQLHSEPIGPKVLIRNALLLALAVFVAVAGFHNPGASATNWIDTLGATEIVGLVLAVVMLSMLLIQGTVLLNLLRQNGRLLVRLESLEVSAPAQESAQIPTTQPAAPVFGLSVGTPAPGFTLPGLHGETLTLDALRAVGRDVLLIFTSPSCGPCATLLPDIATWQREHRDQVTVAVLTTGTVEANTSKMAQHGLTTILRQEQYEVAQAYQYRGTPSAVFVSADGVVATPLVAGADAIRELVTTRLNAPPSHLVPLPRPIAAPPVANHVAKNSRVGEMAPAFDLPDLAGRQVRLADFRGTDIILLFWNTGCGFCRRMIAALKAWEEEKPASSPEIVIVSSGSPDEMRAMGLRSTIIPDPTSGVMNAYGANGTPMAVLIDTNGRIASETAAGAEATLTLAGRRASPGDSLVLQDHVHRANDSNGHHGAKIGDPAPAIRLPDLEGKIVDLASFRGRDTLVLFWNTGCGFCRTMLPDFVHWEQTKPPGATELLVVASGPVEEIRAMGLRSAVVIDSSMVTGQSYGALGTPMAVLVDGQGKIASEVAAGAQAVMALATARGSASLTV